MTIPTDEVLADLHITLWREQMAQRERAETAEQRCEELERLLVEAKAREAAWAVSAGGGS